MTQKATKRLPKKLKEKWVKALRSGKYKQTTGNLCDKMSDGTNSYCCLGVLKHICTGKNDYKGLIYFGPNKVLNYKLPKTSDSASVAGYLADKNDNGLSFKCIANWIEKNL